MRPNEQTTVAVVYALGMRSGWTGNLRTAAETLEIKNYEDLTPLREALRNWADLLRTLFDQEVAKLQPTLQRTQHDL